MLDLSNTSPEIDAASPEMAVLGIGAYEQHTKNLPVGTDWITVSEISRRIAVRVNALLIPAVPYSMSQCHGKMAGTVWLKPGTLARLIEDAVFSLYEQGIKKIVLINGHGGNFILQPLVQELNHTYSDLSLFLLDFMSLKLFEFEGVYDIHAGTKEISIQLYLNKENVGEEPVDYIPPVGREFLDYTVMEIISPEGVWGTQSKGSEELGKKLLESAVKECVQKINQFFNIMERKKGEN